VSARVRAIVGAGSGGLALAAAAADAGWIVRLTDADPDVVRPLADAAVVEARGVVEGVFPLADVSADADRIVEGADVIALVVPATEQGAAAAALAHALADYQLVLVLPGCTGGALEVAAVLRPAGRGPLVAEVDAFPYACAKTGPASCSVAAVKARFRVAAVPAGDSAAALERLAPLFPQAVAAASVLDTSLSNMNAVLHVPGMLTNLGRVESPDGFDFYGAGVTPSVARLIDAYDAERVQLAVALGASVPTLPEWVSAAYGVEAAGTYEMLQLLHRDVYGASPAPSSLGHRYLTEDVPCGAVPVASLSRQLGLAAPAHEALVSLASIACDIDFATAGRTSAKLGLAGLEPDGIWRRALG
jgi:opine dehydrogenase